MDKIFEYAIQALISMFASSMISRQNYQQAESASALAFARQQEATRENREYYSYQNQAQQLKEAGYNPHITQPTTVQVMSPARETPALQYDTDMFSKAMRQVFDASKIGQKDTEIALKEKKFDLDVEYYKMELNNSEIINRMRERDILFKEGQIATQAYDLENRQDVDNFEVMIDDGQGGKRAVKTKYLDAEQKAIMCNRAITEIAGLNQEQSVFVQRWADEHNLNLAKIADLRHAMELADKEFNLKKIMGVQQMEYYYKQLDLLEAESKKVDTETNALSYDLGLRKKHEKTDRFLQVSGEITSQICQVANTAANVVKAVKPTPDVNVTKNSTNYIQNNK